MNIKLPQLLPVCNVPQEQFCKDCRSLETGRGLRQHFLQSYDIDCDVDFECPKNKPWNNKEGSTPSKEPEMNVKSISKVQVQQIEKREPGFTQTIMGYSVGKTAAEFLIPVDKFVLLKEKYDLKEISTISDPAPSKIMTKSSNKKKGCSSCGRRK